MVMIEKIKYFIQSIKCFLGFHEEPKYVRDLSRPGHQYGICPHCGSIICEKLS